MIVLLIIYMFGFVFVGCVCGWLINDADEDISLLDLLKMVLLTLLSWGAVLLFFLTVICDKMEECCDKIIIKKGKKEDEE